jgi:predicted RNA methylase
LPYPINACQRALEVFTVEKYPLEYAMAQNNLGNAYNKLAEVKDKETNAQNAIIACQKALEIYTIEKYPIEYTRTQSNLEYAKGLLI